MDVHTCRGNQNRAVPKLFYNGKFLFVIKNLRSLKKLHFKIFILYSLLATSVSSMTNVSNMRRNDQYVPSFKFILNIYI
jgi:hypothetical protein